MARLYGADIYICDMCGRQDKRPSGRLALTKGTQPNMKTVRSWGLCESCVNRFSAIECVSDKLRDEIRTKVAQLQIKQHPLDLLK